MSIIITAETVDELRDLVAGLLFPERETGTAEKSSRWDVRACSLTELGEIAQKRFADAGFTLTITETEKGKSKLKENLEASLALENSNREEVQAQAEAADKTEEPAPRPRGRPKGSTTNGKSVQAEEAQSPEDPEDKKTRCIKAMMDLYSRDAEGADLVKGMLKRYGNGAKKFLEIDVSQFDAIAKELEAANV